MKVKHYFSTFDDAKSELYVYTTLYDAEKHMATTKKQENEFNLCAVINSKIYEPKEGRQGKGQEMFVVVDPSCYEDMVKQREYCVHVSSSSLGAFPKIEMGDIIRLNRGLARPDDGLPDFRVFREDDLVIFPLNNEERPRCSANRFIFTKDDVELVKYLKKWSFERYRKPVEKQQANTEATDKNPITLSEIKLREKFNLSCRVVEFFEEERGVAIWVEDGTRCPHITLLGNLNLERQMLLYLREVDPVVEPLPNITVVQFEIIGAIELLPRNTRYHKSLMQRLVKVKVSIEDIEQNIQLTEKMDVQTNIQQPSNEDQQVVLQPRKEDPSNKEATATNPEEKNSERISPQQDLEQNLCAVD